jgi:hypothetical protein
VLSYKADISVLYVSYVDAKQNLSPTNGSQKNVRELVFVTITCKAVDFVQVTLCLLRSYASCKLGNKYSVS